MILCFSLNIYSSRSGAGFAYLRKIGRIFKGGPRLINNRLLTLVIIHDDWKGPKKKNLGYIFFFVQFFGFCSISSNKEEVERQPGPAHSLCSSLTFDSPPPTVITSKQPDDWNLIINFHCYLPTRVPYLFSYIYTFTPLLPVYSFFHLQHMKSYFVYTLTVLQCNPLWHLFFKFLEKVMFSPDIFNF